MSALEVPESQNRPQSMASTAVPSVAQTPESGSEKNVELQRPESARSVPRSIHGSLKDVALDEKKKSDDTPAGEEEEDESKYPGNAKLIVIMIALCLVVFLIALDQTIIATAIPKITDQFQALDDVGWYGSAYMLTMCSFQLIFGRLYTFFNLKWTFLVAIFIFEAGSLVCGIAPNSTALIIGRAIAGLGCSGIFSGAILILTASLPLRKRPAYSGMLGAMFGLASVAGPLMGGAFTDNKHLTWRWCFYINLPIGAITMGVIFWFFESPTKEDPEIMNLSAIEKLKKFDFLGTAFLLPGVVCLLLALTWGGTTYAWKSWRIILCLVMFGVLIIAFAVVQVMRGELATLPPRIIKQRTVASGASVAFFIGGGFLLLVFFLPLWFQAIKSVSAVKSGIMNLPLILGVVILSLISGIGTTVTGWYNPFVLAGTAIMAIGSGLLITFETDTMHEKWISYQFLAGAGTGLAMQLPLIAVQTVLAPKDVPTGTATIIFGQSLGGALFISVGQNVFNNKLVAGLLEVVPDLPIATIMGAGATGLKNVVPQDKLPQVIWAYNHALTNCFIPSIALACGGFIAALFLEWKSVKGKKIDMAAA